MSLITNFYKYSFVSYLGLDKEENWSSSRLVYASYAINEPSTWITSSILPSSSWIPSTSTTSYHGSTHARIFSLVPSWHSTSTSSFHEKRVDAFPTLNSN